MIGGEGGGLTHNRHGYQSMIRNFFWTLTTVDHFNNIVRNTVITWIQLSIKVNYLIV